MMKLTDVKAKARQLGIVDLPAGRTELIRMIQSYEGFSPCFKTKDKCDQMQCCWRKECLKK